MSIFAPQNVMGPAHRGNVIQQLAQGAAQNVMRRQKLKALLQHTAGQAGGVLDIGGGHPVRSSMMGHATGVRGATFRPGQGAPLGSPGQSFMSASGGAGAPVANYPDAGSQDLPSLPSNDPTQSPSSTQPGPTLSGYGPSGTSGLGPDGVYIGDPAYSAQFPQDNPDSGGAMDSPALAGNGQLIPLGNGHFYDPATDQITTGGGIRPGLQQ